MFKPFRFLLIIFLEISYLPASCQQSKIILPFELIDNRPFILVYINGHPLHFILDTGAGNTIDKDKADSLGLQLQSLGTQYGAGNNAANIWRTSADSIRI